MIGLIIMIAGVLAILCLPILLERDVPLSVKIIVPSITACLLAWTTVSILQPPVLIEEIHLSYTIDSVDVVVDNENKVINLNEKLKRRVEPGTEIKMNYLYGGWYAGIYWPEGKMPRDIEINE